MAAIGKFHLYANMAGKLRFHRRFEDIGVWIAHPMQGTGYAPPHFHFGVIKNGMWRFFIHESFYVPNTGGLCGKSTMLWEFSQMVCGGFGMPPW